MTSQVPIMTLCDIIYTFIPTGAGEDEIEKGFLVFLGITHTDTKEQADYLVIKLCNLRVFTDREGKMNLGLKEVVGEL